MKTKLKFLAVYCLFITVLTFNQLFAEASSFTDIHNLADETKQEVMDLTNRNIIKGTSPTTFTPNAPVTRGQVVKMMGRYIESNGIAKVQKNWEQSSRFYDVPSSEKDRELLKYSTLLYDTGIFKGQNKRLHPFQPITREQMTLTLERLMKLTRDYSLIDYAYDLDSYVADLHLASEEAKPYIEALNALDLSNVDNFNPKGSVKRVHFASFLSRIIQLIERNHHVIHYEKTAQELGFKEISNVTTIDGSSLQVTFTDAKVHMYARYDGDYLINEEVIIEGTNLFDRPHVSRMHLSNQFLDPHVFETFKKYIPGDHGHVNMSLFLMHSFTDEYYKLLDSGKVYTSKTPYQDDQGIFMFFQHRDSGIIEHTINGNVLSIVNGEITRTPKTVHHRYYFDYQGVMVTDTDAKNYVGDRRYEITKDGDVLFEGKPLDRTLYYLPLVRPIPFTTYNDVFGGFTYTDDVTFQQILAFHQTDGQKSSIPKRFMHQSVLIIDSEKNIYGTFDLRDATFDQFEQSKSM